LAWVYCILPPGAAGIDLIRWDETAFLPARLGKAGCLDKIAKTIKESGDKKEKY